MREPEVALVYSPRDWAERLTRFAADHGELRVRAKVLDEGDALEQDYRVLVLDDFTHFLSRRFVDEVHRLGRSVLGVYDPAELSPEETASAGKERLRQCDVDDVIEAQATPAEFVASINVLAATAGVPSEEAVRTPGDPASGGEEEQQAVRPGIVTVVASTSGGAGATEIAIALAAAAGGRGERPVLVDADDVAPSVAQRLGLGLWPNIRAAVEAYHESPDRLQSTLVAFPPGGLGGSFEVVPGLSSPRDWSALRPAEVVGVVRDLAGSRHHVIVDVGGRVEDLAWLGEPERHGVSRGLLAAADAVVAVGIPTPVGVARVLAWVADVQGITDGIPIHVVFNRTPSSSFKRTEVEDELRAACTPASVHFVPADPRVDGAAWAGAVPEPGPFRKAVARLAEGALPMLAPATGRKRSLLKKARR